MAKEKKEAITGVHELVTLRPAREEERESINELLMSEGFFTVTVVDNITVAANEDDEMVGFIRVADDDEGTAHIYPVVVYETWRGFNVGRVLVEYVMQSRGRVKLISRGYANAFYEALGFKPASWEDMADFVVADCEECELRDECGPQPFVYE